VRDTNASICVVPCEPYALVAFIRRFDRNEFGTEWSTPHECAACDGLIVSVDQNCIVSPRTSEVVAPDFAHPVGERAGVTQERLAANPRTHRKRVGMTVRKRGRHAEGTMVENCPDRRSRAGS
jgi:hypothetical protein